MRIYISGKITGLDIEVAKMYFESVENQLTQAGHTAINPMKIHPSLEGPTWHDFMAADIQALLGCEAILMLDNWTTSKGAKIEHDLAERLGLQMFYSKNHNFF